MHETVTVDEALTRGKRMVNLPVYLILFGFPAVGVLMFVQFQINGWLATILCLLGIVFGWLWWSFAIPKWRLWAFANVRNKNQLKERAIQEQLIWPDGSWFEKTEIWSTEQRQRWTALKAKLAEEDQFEDDLSIPTQTEIYLSKSKSVGTLIMGIVFLGLGFYLYSEDGSTRVSWMALIMGPGIAIYGFINMRNQTPQITLSDDGVKLANSDFYPWIDVKWERIEVISGNKGGGANFVFMTFDGIKSTDIAELAISRRRLDTLLRIYRGRNNKKFVGKTTFTQTKRLQ